MGEIDEVVQRCERCRGYTWIPDPEGGLYGIKSCPDCQEIGGLRTEPVDEPKGEVDGGALTPAECEAKMRGDRDRAMRVGLGFEAADSGKPREPKLTIKLPDGILHPATAAEIEAADRAKRAVDVLRRQQDVERFIDRV